jgi:RNA polymerase sigma factor (sigma-70 family)
MALIADRHFTGDVTAASYSGVHFPRQRSAHVTHQHPKAVFSSARPSAPVNWHNPMNDQSQISAFVGPRRQPADPRRLVEDENFAALMLAAQRGDESAYASLLREVMPLLRRLLRSRLRFAPAADRDDLMQEVLLSMHKALATYDAGRPFLPWLTAIVRNRIVDRARRHTRLSANEVLVGDWASLGPLEGLAQMENEYLDQETLKRAINSLPKGQQMAFELLRLRELSLEEAANALGISAGAVRVSIHRAVKNLRKLLS